MSEQHWHHVILTTYGAWLDGDARGFRTRHHREHVEGDYQNPPHEGMYTAREAHSRETLKQPPVLLDRDWREMLLTALRDAFERRNLQPLCIAVASQHSHILARLTSGEERTQIGTIKSLVWRSLRDRGWQTRLWGKRCRALRIRNRAQQSNTFRYIVNHAQEGAAVWQFDRPG